jgi:membrane-associated phospholipid phosphatase
MELLGMRIFEPDRWSRIMYPRTLQGLALFTFFLILLSILVRLRATYKLDVAITLALQRWSTPVVGFIMKWLTWLGNTRTVVILAVACAIIAALAKDLRAAMFVGTSLLAFPINVALKRVFTRDRPGEKEVKIHPGPRWGFSYPSGHAMGSTAFYGFLAVLIFLHTPDSMIRQFTTLPLVLLPPSIGISRIYMGAHWFSDVLGGIAAGSILIAFLVVLYPV